MEEIRTGFVWDSRLQPSISNADCCFIRIDSPSYPPYHTRLALARLFLELSLHSNALEILQRLENEDDEDGEIWYLSGWAWWLLGEEREENESTPEEESRGECWSEAKLCLENYLKV